MHLGKCNNGTVPFSACLQLAARQLGSEIRITPHNACYFNASIQAFFWFGALAGNDGHLYGAAKAGVSILRHKRRIYFPDSIAWRFVFARWDNLCRRQDASEFLRRLVSRTSPAAYSGHWEARLRNPVHAVDSGVLGSSLLLHLGGDSRQTLIRLWRDQFAAHALVKHSGLVMLQLCRYQNAALKDRIGLCH